MNRKFILIMMIALMFVLFSCKSTSANENTNYKDLFDTYEEYANYCNGHRSNTDPWTLYVDQDTPDDVIDYLNDNYLVKKRDAQEISIDNLSDITLGYFAKVSIWSTIENKDTFIKVVTESSTEIDSAFIQGFIDADLIIVEYSEGDLVFTS